MKPSDAKLHELALQLADLLVPEFSGIRVS